MKKEEYMPKILGCSVATYYTRRKKGNLAIQLIEQYLTKNDVLEFIDKGKITKFENFQKIEENSTQIYVDFLKKLDFFCIKLFFQIQKDENFIENVLNFEGVDNKIKSMLLREFDYQKAPFIFYAFDFIQLKKLKPFINLSQEQIIELEQLQ